MLYENKNIYDSHEITEKSEISTGSFMTCMFQSLSYFV